MSSVPPLINPFPGLRPFTQEEDYLFFGREEQTLELLQRLGSNRFVAVVGTSGSGKSSLVRCGLLSELLGGRMLGAGSAWEIAVTHPGGNPLALLTDSLLEADLYDRREEHARENLLATLSRSHFGLVEAVKQADLGEGTNFLLVVDQFEEIFRFQDAGQRQQEVANEFVSLLLEAVAQKEVPIYVVLTMRSDFIGECGQFEGLAEMVNRGEFLIPRLTREQYKRVIEGPIKVAGGQIAPRLLQRLLNDLGQQADQLPCLQHALMRTWDFWAGKGDGEALDLDDYQRVGRMAEAMSLHADEIYESLARDRQRELCRDIFQALTVEESNSRGIRRPQRLGRLCQILEVPTEELVPIIDAYRHSGVTFLIPAPDVELTDQTIIDISHESLMRVWTRLRQWVEEETQAAGIYHRLSESAALHELGKAGLYRDPELGIALAWREAKHPNAAWAERYRPGFATAIGFLEASQQASVAEEQARDAARQRELAQTRQLAETQAKVARLFKRFAGGLAVGLFLAVATTVWAFMLRHEAKRQEAAASYYAVEASNQAKQAEAESRLARLAELSARKLAASETEAKTLARQETHRAEAERKRADEVAENAQRNLYYAQMHMGQQAWREHRGSGRMHEMLANWIPSGDSPERRGWEWFYLNSLPFQNLRTFVEEDQHRRDFATLVAWHIPSRRLAEGTPEGVIRIWDVDREQPILTMQMPVPDVPWWGRDWFAWSPDGNQLAAGARNGTVHVRETRSGRELMVLLGHNSPVVAVEFSSDGTRVAAWGANGAIKIWDLDTGRLAGEITHSGGVTGGSWSPDNQLLVSGHLDGSVSVSGIQVGSQIATWKADFDTIYRLAWSPDSSRIATTTQRGSFVSIWDVASKSMVLGPLRHSHVICSIAWEADGQRLATGGIDQTIKIWNASTGSETVTLRGNRQTVCSLSWGPDGHLAYGSADGSVKIWNPIRDQESSVIPGDVRQTSVAWNPASNGLAMAGDDGRVRIWDAAQHTEIVSLDAHDKTRTGWQFGLIPSLAWHPDGNQLASASSDGTAKVWDASTSQVTFALPADHGAVRCVAWSPDGSQLAAGSEDGTIRIVDMINYTPQVRVFQAHTPPDIRTMTLAWSPQGDRLASCVWGVTHAKIWDPTTGTELARMLGGSGVLKMAWSPDGKRLATGSTDFLVAAWDAETGQKLSTMRGHSDFVVGVAWSPDGTRLASAGFDHSVRIWNPETGEETFVLRGAAGMFHDISWNPDGAQLAAACSDGQIWIWDATRGYERDTTPRALPYIDRAVAAGTARGEELRWFAESLLRAGKAREALDAVKDDPVALAKIALALRNRGDASLADEARTKAIALLESRRSVEPANEELASGLADFLLMGSDDGWSVLRPTEMKSAGGATLTLQSDGSVLAGGNDLKGDEYSIVTTPGLQHITAIRLEALPDPSLPQNGPGRHPSGNFQLSAVKLFEPREDENSKSIQIPFNGVSASYAYHAWDADPAGVIDESVGKVWHVWGQAGRPHHLTLRLARPLAVTAGQTLKFELDHANQVHNVNLGRFRLSVSGEPTAFERERKRSAAMKLIDPWAKLAVAYDFIGDQSALSRLLEQHPAAAVGAADIAADAKDWDPAIAAYCQLITPHTTDVTLLAKRAAAYIATEQWELAKADWMRVIELQPAQLQQAFETFRNAERWSEAAGFGQKRLEQNPEMESWRWLPVAAVVARSGDKTAYTEFCNRMLQRFADSEDISDAERTTKACLLLPDAMDLSRLPTDKFTQPLDDGTATDWFQPWGWCARALLAYRNGDAAASVKYVAKSEEFKPTDVPHALNEAVLALAQHQLQHPDEARTALEEVSQLIARLKASPARKGDHDLLIAEILFREAEVRINGTTEPEPPNDATTPAP